MGGGEGGVVVERQAVEGGAQGGRLVGGEGGGVHGGGRESGGRSEDGEGEVDSSTFWRHGSSLASPWERKQKCGMRHTNARVMSCVFIW